MKRRHRKIHTGFWLLSTPLFLALMIYAALDTRLPPISTDALHDSSQHHGGDLQ